jgi:hypothetical protein
MDLTDEMAKTIRENFNLEVEMLQGSQEKLADGRTRYIVEVRGEKMEMVQEFILKLISNSHNVILN